MPATITKPYRVKKSVFFAVLLLVLLTSVVSIYSAPDQQQDSPTTSESLPYLALEHYEMNPRAYMETLPADPDAPTAPTSPSYIPWSLVVYQSYRTNHWDIYLSDDEGSYETRLTTSGDDEIHPRLNRGGTRIAYAVDQGGDYEIYVMNRDGTNKTHLTNNSTDDVNPYWSPDGTQIVFQAYRDGQPEIYVMNADGSGQTRLTNSGDYDGMPAWSPDGAKIAFASRRTGGYRIYTMNPDGSSQIQLSNQPYSLEPAWSPDSTRIAYSSDGDNNTWFEIWTMNADGSSQTLKHSLAGGQDTLTRSWSPNGSYIAYTKINYIYYQGTWYWTDSYLEAVNFGILGPNTFPNRNWYPDWQTLDNQKPTSQVTALTPISPAVFTVTWGGSDAGGSGLKNYDVQVRDGANGAWTAWNGQRYILV